jgi:nuclear pore complex protein Nup107
LLRLEANTWGLLQAILSYVHLSVAYAAGAHLFKVAALAKQIPESPLTPTAKDLLLENPYIPMSTLARTIIRASPLLTELIVVQEWLHDTAPPPEANTGY